MLFIFLLLSYVNAIVLIPLIQLILHVNRRQAFWVAKQLLQLGMGDAFDDWLIEKIQLLRKGTVVASAINRVEQVNSGIIA